MNCHDFERIIVGLAPTRWPDASADGQALAHAQTCAGCAATLAEQRALAAGVRAVIESIADDGASPHVEAALRQAFRQRAAARVQSSSSFLPIGSRLWWLLGAMAAAMILLVFLPTMKWRTSPPIDRERPSVSRSSPVGRAPRPQDETPQWIRATDQPGYELARPASRQPRRNRMRPTVRQDPAQADEATLSFIPLADGSEFIPLESGQVIRVQLPGSMLLRMGLPVSAERAQDTVPAQLLVGQDGRPRAIRFER
jgi:hypothetical protein